MSEQSPNFSQQLESLKHDWRSLPYMAAAVNRAKQIIEHPENYLCQRDTFFPKDIVPLTKAIQNGENPLSGITYLYDISHLQQKNPASRQKKFLQIHFKFCNSLSREPRPPEEFEASASILHASVDNEGKILPMTATYFRLKMTRGFRGNKIELLIPEMVPKSMRSEFKDEINNMMKPASIDEPYETTYYSWTGNQVNILPKPKDENPS